MAKRILVIGLGRFGSSLAVNLKEKGVYVVGVDIEEERGKELKDRIDLLYIGDVTSETFLDHLLIANYDAVVLAIGESTEVNLTAAMMLKERGVKKLIARAIDSRCAALLKKIGVDEVVEVEKEMGEKLAERIAFPLPGDVVDFWQDFVIYSFLVPGKWSGKRLKDLNLISNYNVTILGRVGDGERLEVISAAEVLKEGEKLLAFGKRKAIRLLYEKELV